MDMWEFDKNVRNKNDLKRWQKCRKRKGREELEGLHIYVKMG